MNKERLDYIDILKGMGILMVIFSHSGAEQGGAMVFVGGVFIPLFFVSSGFTYGCVKTPFSVVFQKRARRLLLPYFFFSVLMLLLYKCYTWTDLLGIMYSRYCLYPYAERVNVVLMRGGSPPLWFLTSMLVSYVPFFFLLNYPTKRRMLLLVFVLFTIICQHIPILLPWSIDSSCVFAAFMFVGVMIRKNMVFLVFSRRCFFILLFLYAIFCMINGETSVSVGEYGRSFIIYFFTGVLGTILLIWLSIKMQNHMLGFFFSQIGRHSLVIFSLQMFLLRICHQVFHSMLHFPTEGILFYLITLIKILMVAILGMCISKGTNRYMPWLFK